MKLQKFKFILINYVFFWVLTTSNIYYAFHIYLNDINTNFMKIKIQCMDVYEPFPATILNGIVGLRQARAVVQRMGDAWRLQ